MSDSTATAVSTANVAGPDLPAPRLVASGAIAIPVQLPPEDPTRTSQINMLLAVPRRVSTEKRV
jgi:hypothetical protein